MTKQPDDPTWRGRARRALERYFRQRSWPRLILTLVLALTGMAGFAISAGLLHLGLVHMWLRYPLVVVAAYGVFLLLLRGWVELEKRDFDPQPGEIEDSIRETPVGGDEPIYSRRGSWLDWLNVPDLGHADDGCILAALLMMVLIALLAILIYAIIFASALIAEVFLDAFIVVVLYRRLRLAARENWLGTAVRRTWHLVFLTAALLSLAGWCLEASAPGSHSIGPGMRRLLERPAPNRPDPLTNR